MMNPSIISFLEDDEDETMHSGADVEAFTAALNRDIEGDTSTSQPSEPGSGLTPHGSNPTSNQLFAQWQSSIKEEKVSNQTHQEELHKLQPQEKNPSEVELVPRGSNANNQQQQTNQTIRPVEHAQLPLQQKQCHDDHLQRQSEQNLPQFSQANVVQKSEQKAGHFPEPDRLRHLDTQNQYPKMQKMNSQQPSTGEATNNPMTRNKQVPFGLLLPAIRPHLDKDRAMQLDTLFGKLRKNEINKEGFVRLMRNIVGDQMLRMAINKVQVQSARNPQTGPQQYHLQSQTSQQQQSDSSFQTNENKAQMSRETEQTDSQGMHVGQMSSASMNTITQDRELHASSVRGLNKQQPQHHIPQTSFPMYGAPISNYHANPYSVTPSTVASTALKPQIQDSQMRQVSLHQGIGSTQSGGASQPQNVMSAAKYDMQTSTSDAKRLHSVSLSQSTSNSTLQHNPAQWQSSMNKEQKISTLPSVTYVKQEAIDPTQDMQPKSQAPTSSFGARVDQGNTAPSGTLKDDVLEKQSSRTVFSTSITTVPAHSPSGSMATQVDPSVQTQIPSTTTPFGAGINGKTPSKKPSVGQKKPADALGTSPPMASKKQKVSGAFLDQSIEQLNDVTAVSGVNIREEEEQLFSGPKEDSRASEATRRVVQEEEERLILQKNPLQKKLAKIMSKSGIKNISSDVERCLSLCVEERMRGLISNLIRLSKQRVDIEKPRHRSHITSDVRRQILLMNRKAKDDLEKKQAEEAEKLRKLNEADGNTGADGEKDKDDGRLKALKANKDEDDKMRTTAANVAARVAVGGDDMLSKWQLMAEQAKQKREGGVDMASPKDVNRKSSSTSGRTARDNQDSESRSPSTASGAMRKFGRNQIMAHPKIARSVTVKDVIVALEREPQMSKSTLIYRLLDRVPADVAPPPAE